MAMSCAKCGYPIDPGQASDPCPECGSIDRNIMVKDTFSFLEMIKLKAKDKDGFKLFERKQGEKLSKHGRKARESLEIDHRDPEKTTKTHTVEEQMEDGNWGPRHNERSTSPAKHRPK